MEIVSSLEGGNPRGNRIWQTVRKEFGNARMKRLMEKRQEHNLFTQGVQQLLTRAVQTTSIKNLALTYANSIEYSKDMEEDDDD